MSHTTSKMRGVEEALQWVQLALGIDTDTDTTGGDRSSITKILDKVNELKREVSGRKEEVEKYKRELERCSVEEFEAQIAKRNKKVDKMKMEMQKLQEEIEKYKNDFEQSNNGYKNQISSANEKLQQVTSDMEKSREETERCKRELEQSTMEYMRKISEKSEKLQRLSDDVKRSEMEAEKYKDSCEQLKNNYESELAKTHEKLEELLKNAESNKNEAEGYKAELESTKSFLQEIIDANETKVAELEEQLNSLAAINESLRTSDETSKESKTENEECELESSNSSLQAVIEEKDVKIAELQNLVISLTVRNESLTKSVEAMGEAKEIGGENHMESTLHETIAAGEVKIKELEKMVASLIENNKSLTQSVEAMGEAKEDAEQVRTECERELATLDYKLARKAEKVENLEDSVARLYDEGLVKDAKMDLMQKQLGSLIENNESLTKSVESMRETKKDNGGENELESMKSLKAQLEAKEVEIADMEKRMKAAMENYQSLSKTLTLFEEHMRHSGKEYYRHSIGARFTGIAKLSFGEIVRSKSIRLADADWVISISISQRRDEKFLGVYLDVVNAVPESWACGMRLKLHLLSQLGGESETRAVSNTVFTYTNLERNFGFKKLISYKDLFSKKNGFVKDDSIHVSIEMKMFPSV